MKWKREGEVVVEVWWLLSRLAAEIYVGSDASCVGGDLLHL